MAEMDHVPVGSVAILGRVLAHRRDHDPVLQAKVAQGQRLKQTAHQQLLSTENGPWHAPLGPADQAGNDGLASLIYVELEPRYRPTPPARTPPICRQRRALGSLISISINESGCGEAFM